MKITLLILSSLLSSETIGEADALAQQRLESLDLSRPKLLLLQEESPLLESAEQAVVEGRYTLAYATFKNLALKLNQPDAGIAGFNAYLLAGLLGRMDEGALEIASAPDSSPKVLEILRVR